jgi:two-component system, OmpR family, alkaline phosphatase synthesis response regulator PhoP
MSKNILVIEDDLEILANVEEILELQEFDTVSATDGSLGLRLAKRQLPDLVVCDVMLPRLDGYSILQELRQHEETSATPFIFLSAKSQRADVRRAMELGADDYIMKPFTGGELIKSVNVCLDKYETLITRQVPDSPLPCVIQDLSEAHLVLLEHLTENLRRPIANISVAAHMLRRATSEAERDRYLSILEEEITRQGAILNHSAQTQELLSTSGLNVLRQLGLLKN